MLQGEDPRVSRQSSASTTEERESAKAVPDEVEDHVECAGLIFMCDESTRIDCFKYRVFGMSKKKKHLMDVITKGMNLFLFDVKLKVLHGIYAASSCGGFQLEPDAFAGSFPWQVRFCIEKACIPLSEDVFRSTLKENYFSARKFKSELTPEQVQKLVSLFSPLPSQDPSLEKHRTYPAPIKRVHTQSQGTQTLGSLSHKSIFVETDSNVPSSSTSVIYTPTAPLLDNVTSRNCGCCFEPQTEWILWDHVPEECVDHSSLLNYQSSCQAGDASDEACVLGFHVSDTQNEQIYINPEQQIIDESLNLCHKSMSIIPPRGQERWTSAVNELPVVVELIPSCLQSEVCNSSSLLHHSFGGCVSSHYSPLRFHKTLSEENAPTPTLAGGLPTCPYSLEGTCLLSD